MQTTTVYFVTTRIKKGKHIGLTIFADVSKAFNSAERLAKEFNLSPAPDDRQLKVGEYRVDRYEISDRVMPMMQVRI